LPVPACPGGKGHPLALRQVVQPLGDGQRFLYGLVCHPAADGRQVFHAGLFQDAWVAKYWLVDPEARTVEVYVLRQGAYLPYGRWGPGEKASSALLAGFEVAVADICPR